MTNAAIQSLADYRLTQCDKPASPARRFLVIVSCPLFPSLPQPASDFISCAPTPLDRHHLFPVSLDHHSPTGYWHSFPVLLLAHPCPSTTSLLSDQGLSYCLLLCPTSLDSKDLIITLCTCYLTHSPWLLCPV